MKKHFLHVGVLALTLLSVSLLPFASTVHAASAVMNIPDRYAAVNAGDRFYYELSVLYPENPGRRDLTVTYRIQEGKATVVSGQYLRAVETQASFSDYIVIPTAAHPGLHTIEVEVSDGNDVLADVSGSFQVNPAQDWMTIYFLILLGVIVFVGVVLFIEVLVVSRHRHS